MGQGCEIHRRHYLHWRSRMIHRHYTTAVRASSEKWLVILIERQIPQDNAFRPIPRRVDNQPRLLFEQIALLPVAAGALRHPDFFVRKTLMQFGLSRRHAAITMSRRASRK